MVPSRQRTVEARDVNHFPAQVVSSESCRAPARCVICWCASLRPVRPRTCPDRMAPRSNGRDARSLPGLHRRYKRQRGNSETRLTTCALVAILTNTTPRSSDLVGSVGSFISAWASVARSVAERRQSHREYRASAAAVVGQVALMLADDAIGHEEAQP